jgi:medium-chain acyl-[acyl-carrier-protein] hydrolase
MDAQWVFRLTPRSNPKLRLVCFPHAGKGPSMFNSWSRELPNTIEVCAVQLPGRESRIGEPSISAMPELVAQLVNGLAGTMQGVFAFYGHSIGALTAFELTRELRRRGKVLPVHLLVSGRRAPQCPALPPAYQLNDREFLAHIIKRYGELPRHVLADDEVLSLYLRIVRADVALMDTYRYREEPSLTVPIAAYGGHQDGTLTPPLLDAWRMQTTSTFRSKMFDGGHFFPDALGPQFLRTIVDDLGPMVATKPW